MQSQDILRRANLDAAQSQGAEQNLSPSLIQIVIVGFISQINLTFRVVFKSD